MTVVTWVLQLASGFMDTSRTEPPNEGAGARCELAPTTWPSNYSAIKRVQFETLEKSVCLLQEFAKEGYPIIIEGSKLLDVEKWSDIGYLQGLLQQRTVLVKKSPNNRFRYFDLKKNTGGNEFKQPLVEEQMELGDFLRQAQGILDQGLESRMYLQETLSGHAEMADEFVTWNWEFLIRASTSCQWGLPDSNELFIGMPGVETPLHFDERENLFFQVRGRKEVVLFPFVDYTCMYPFPTTHACDRQSMVGDPRTPDLTAFPRFRHVVGHHAELQPGDLLYLPYGWWHWLRSLDHLSTSMSFWSTTPPSDLSKGVPEEFTDHMLTRVLRNLESIIAQKEPKKHNESMLAIRDAISQGDSSNECLNSVRVLLAAVKIPSEKQDQFLLTMIDGRFGIDWNRYV